MLPLRHPFTAIVAGPTSCGKTRFVFRLIDNVGRMIDPPPSKIVYCYGEYQQLFCNYPRVVFHQGLPDLNDFDGTEPTLLIIDDLMQETNETVVNLFTKGSHHRNVSVMYLAQNLFPKNKFARTMSLNAHYMVLFKNPRDASSLRIWRDRCIRRDRSLPLKYIRMLRGSHIVICSSTSVRNRTTICVCERTYFPERHTTCTPLNEQAC